MLSNHIHTEPGSASAAVPHSLRLGRAETPGRKPPHVSIFGVGVGKCWPLGPQAAKWVARDQSPLRGTTAGDQLAPRTEQSHSAKPGSQRLEESSGLGAGLPGDRPRRAQTHAGHHDLVHTQMHACVLSHDPCTHLSAQEYVQGGRGGPRCRTELTLSAPQSQPGGRRIAGGQGRATLSEDCPVSQSATPQGL